MHRSLFVSEEPWYIPEQIEHSHCKSLKNYYMYLKKIILTHEILNWEVFDSRF